MDGCTARLARALAHPRAMWVVVGLTACLVAPSAGTGFCTDDYGFRAMASSGSALAPKAYDLFRFAPGDEDTNRLLVHYGVMPWWSAPDLKVHFIRPLTSLLVAADDAAFGDRAVLYHLHSLAWYLALLVCVGFLFRRVLGGAAATLALATFALAGAHTL